MNNWAAVLAGLLILMVLMHLAARLWPKRAGYRYLKYNLARRGIRTAQIPPDCIRAFVDEAYDYARLVCTPAAGVPRAAARVDHFEFERMLRIHCFVIHSLLTGRMGGAADGSVPVAGDEVQMRELIRSEMLRAGVEPFGDPAHCQRIESEVRAGGSWARYRAILGRYDLPAPIASESARAAAD